ncbi:sugar ABC transporter permease [Pullulanibacillus sp. KACC 23026]|uniref:carbohydrate ABC transporter permease n=1 Tax=Pullulanibacillus sp. KACC 23026 TaxID=3028315 RepID=UPI0023B0E36B|nr:sugar ABC transporter permease [Pullulanibacillus sp. KACC 23026]WEG12866.1 sugar ABC transporter permease [Pullulanibacillus sp. KACC 23026]
MNWQRWIMVIPALVFFAIFAIIPMCVAVYYTGLNWDGLTPPTWAGLSNWVQVFQNGEAWQSTRLTIELMVLCWITQNPISLVLGVFMAGKQKHRAVFGVFYFIPLLFSAAAIGVTWSYILNPNFGLVDSLLTALGVKQPVNWLGSPHLALISVSLVIAWQFIPFNSLLYQGGAKQIPESIYEAAKIDGAGPFRTFFSITLPQLKYTIVTSSVLILTGTLTYFDLIYVLTSGGPGTSTQVLAMDMYKQAFMNNNIGMGSVMAIILAVFGLILSLLILKFTGFNNMESQKEGA